MGLIKTNSSQVLVAIVGPTAVGKTDLVLQLAGELGAEVVNVDSMQVYRYMDIGTAKPSIKEMAEIRHHLIDIVDPDDEYNVSRFVKDADKACQDIIARGSLPILTGGTGLYLKGFCWMNEVRSIFLPDWRNATRCLPPGSIPMTHHV
jgi:tRNA dimethylallyltransferase